MNDEKQTREAAPLADGEAGAAAEAQAAPADLKARVIEALREIYDPEIPVNIYDLGLIYGLDVDEATGSVSVEMTLTAPGCPVAQTFPGQVEDRLLAVEGVRDARVELVWDPPWTQDRLSEEAKLQLGLL